MVVHAECTPLLPFGASPEDRPSLSRTALWRFLDTYLKPLPLPQASGGAAKNVVQTCITTPLVATQFSECFSSLQGVLDVTHHFGTVQECSASCCSCTSLDTHSRSYGALPLRRVSSPPRRVSRHTTLKLPHTSPPIPSHHHNVANHTIPPLRAP